MLVQFNVENFKSFKENNSLDLTASNIKEFNERVFEIEEGRRKECLLTVAAIYGANASGKSNFVEALSFMRSYVLNSFLYGGNTTLELKNILNQEQDEIQSLLLKQSSSKPFLYQPDAENSRTEFEVYFIDVRNKTEYNYGFCLKKNKVIEEWLFSKKLKNTKFKEIFYRDGEKISFKGIDKKSSNVIFSVLEPEVLIVSLGAKLKIPILKEIRDWFLKLSILDYAGSIENIPLPKKLYERYRQNVLDKQKLLDYINAFEPNLKDIIFKTKVKDGENHSIETVSIHVDELGNEYELPYIEESAGSKKMIDLFCDLEYVLETGGILVIDDLSSRIHPLLVRSLLHIFLNHDLNPNYAQIIFTLHETDLIDQLRRDEIWFVDKDLISQISSLYSLSQIRGKSNKKIRKDENIVKNYLLGKYGAIPNLKPITTFNKK